MPNKRNFEWPEAATYNGYFTQDKPGGITERVAPLTMIARIQSEGVFQPHNVDLDFISGSNVKAFGRGFLGLTTAADARAYIGVGGSTFDGAYSSLTGVPAAIKALDPLTPSADTIVYYTSPTTAAITTLTTFSRGLLGAVDAPAARTILGTLDAALKGAANGLAELDSSGKVPSTQLPAYVDDVIEVANFGALPVSGESGKIYITIDDGKTYRWGGTAYAEISVSLVLGETSTTAYRGDRGKIAYDHSQLINANPHQTTFGQLLSVPAAISALVPLTPVADRFAYYTGAGTAALTTITAFARTILDDADAATVRGTIGAEPTITTLPVTKGGTGLSAYVIGDMLAANTTTSLTRIAGVATGNVLRSGGVGVLPAWGKVALGTDVSGTLLAAQFPALTGDVTTVAGSLATTIGAGVVTLAKMASLAANSIIGNNTGASATPIALTVAQVQAMLGVSGGPFLRLSGDTMVGNITLPTPNNILTPTSYTAIPTDNSPFTQSTLISYGLHDWSAYTAPTQEKTADGTTWVSDTLATKLFDAYPSTTAVLIINTTTPVYGTRWTWNNVTWSSINKVMLTYAYSGTAPVVNQIVETSPDGLVWTSVGTTTLYDSTRPTIISFGSVGPNAWLRVTIVRASGTGTIPCNSVQLWSTRLGDQGKNKWNYLPFSWDYARKITALGDLKVTGATTLASSITGLLKASAGLVSAAVGGTDYLLPSNVSGTTSQVAVFTGPNTVGSYLGLDYVLSGGRVQTLNLGSSTAGGPTSTRLSINQTTNAAGGGEVYLGAAGAAGDENSGKLIFPGARIIGRTATGDRVKIQIRNAGDTAWEDLLAIQGTSGGTARVDIPTGLFSMGGTTVVTAARAGVLTALTVGSSSGFVRSVSGVYSASALVAADIPSLDASKTTTGIFTVGRLGSGTATISTFLRGDGSWAAISSITATGTASGDLSGSYPSPTVVGIRGQSIPVYANGALRYYGGVISWDNSVWDQAAGVNKVWATPSSTLSGPNTFRALNSLDLPSTIWYGTGGTLNNLSQLANGPGYITSTSLAAYLPLSGGIMTGNITFQDDGEGVFFNSGAGIYKKSGTGLMLRLHSANTNVQIENNAGVVQGSLWHSGNLTNLSQLTNGPGYVTGGPYLALSGGTMNGGASITFQSGGGAAFPTYGSCGIFAGNADNATHSAYNLKIKSWWGIGFESYDGIVRTVLDTRTGNFSTYGSLTIGVGAKLQSATNQLDMHAPSDLNYGVRLSYASGGTDVFCQRDLTASTVFARTSAVQFNYAGTGWIAAKQLGAWSWVAGGGVLPFLGPNEWCFLVCDETAPVNVVWTTNGSQSVRIRSGGTTYTTSAGGGTVGDGGSNFYVTRTTCILIGPTDSGSSACSLIPF